MPPPHIAGLVLEEARRIPDAGHPFAFHASASRCWSATQSDRLLKITPLVSPPRERRLSRAGVLASRERIAGMRCPCRRETPARPAALAAGGETRGVIFSRRI